MGATAFIVIAAGMVVPIALILAALVFDLAVVGWAGYRIVRDRWSPKLGRHLHDHMGGAAGNGLAHGGM